MGPNRSPTMRDVAVCAGYSTATISRVLNNDPRVAEHTRNRVMVCMSKLGYRVNPIARSLKTSRTHTIGIISPEFQNDFFMSAAEGIENYLRANGYISFICNSRENPVEEAELVSMMIEKQVDGIIIIPASSRGGEHYQLLNELEIPYVLVDCLIDGLEADAVLTDNFRGAFTAVERCILGRAGNIALIGGPLDITSARERTEGYRAAMEKYGKTIVEELIVCGDMHVESGYRLMGELLNQDPQLQYVFIINLFMRIGAEKYLLEHKSARDIRIAAFDESAISPLFTHTWVTVRQPLSKIGAQAARLLLRRIKNDNLPFPQVYREMPEVINHS